MSNNKIATCSYDKLVKIWSSQTSSFITELAGHEDEVYQLAFSRKHNILASSSYDKTIKLWKEYEKWRELKTLYGHKGKTWALTFIDSVNKLATGAKD